MSEDVSEALDRLCERKYGHTNWAYHDTFDGKQLEYINEADGKRLEIDGNIVFFYEEADENGDWVPWF